MSCTRGWFPSTAETVPLTGSTAITILLPPIACYFCMAFFVTLPNTRLWRTALLPAGLWTAYRAMTLLDMSKGDPALEGKNGAIPLIMAGAVLRMTGWALERGHLTRIGTETHSYLWDTLHLGFSLSGSGWSSPTAPRKPGRQLSSLEVITQGMISCVVHALAFEGILYVHTVVYDTPEILPWVLRRVLGILIFPGFMYTVHSAHYPILRVFGVVVLRQDSREWPDLYSAPLRSTSLAEFWGKRWHQAVRHMATSTGGRILGGILGRSGFIVGTFIVSGLWHDAGTWGMDRRSGLCCSLTPFFALNGVGVVLENVYGRLTGKRIGGVMGWVWAVSYMLACFLVTFDAGCMEEYHQQVLMSDTDHLQIVKKISSLIT